MAVSENITLLEHLGPSKYTAHAEISSLKGAIISDLYFEAVNNGSELRGQLYISDKCWYIAWLLEPHFLSLHIIKWWCNFQYIPNDSLVITPAPQATTTSILQFMRKICLCHQRCQLWRHLIMRISTSISIGLQKTTSLQDQGTPFPKRDVKTIYLPKHITVHWVSSYNFFQHNIYYFLSLARHVHINPK